MKQRMLPWALAACMPWYAWANDTLLLRQAIDKAAETDPWQQASEYEQQTLREKAVAAGQLPDPKLNLQLANLPTDTFEFSQEPMTQVKVGISQMFPPGDTLALKSERLQTLATVQPVMRQDRQGKSALQVTNLWLDAWLAYSSAAVLEAKRSYFEQLVDVVTSTYATAAARTRQQDVLRAQLELSRLDDRLEGLRQMEGVARGKLAEWIGEASQWPLPQLLPNLDPVVDYTRVERNALQHFWAMHPSVIAIDRKMAAADKEVDIAREKYRPGWGLNASYGYRSEDAQGRDRADFVSLGVTLDLPLRTGSRQDREVKAAVASASALRQRRQLVLRSLSALWDKARENVTSLDDRIVRYRQEILPQMAEEVEATLTAYTNDDGDFADVMRARIAELNAAIDLLKLRVSRLKSIAELNYTLLAAAGEEDQS